jgi:RNA polymerase sigma factor (sigma-70 family)
VAWRGQDAPVVNPPPASPESVCPKAQARWFTEEVHPHDSALKAYLRGAFPSVRDVEDVVQESYLRMWTAQAAQPIRSAKAFLFSVARRLAVDLIRRERRSPIVAVKEIEGLFVLADAPDASAAATKAEEVRLFVAAIGSLPARCREIFILCQIEGLSQREVAERLGLSENTVAVQSARGLQRCEEFVRRRLSQP